MKFMIISFWIEDFLFREEMNKCWLCSNLFVFLCPVTIHHEDFYKVKTASCIENVLRITYNRPHSHFFEKQNFVFEAENTFNFRFLTRLWRLLCFCKCIDYRDFQGNYFLVRVDSVFVLLVLFVFPQTFFCCLEGTSECNYTLPKKKKT